MMDVVWGPFVTWNGVWKWWEGRFSSPMHYVISVGNVCRATRRAARDVWREIHWSRCDSLDGRARVLEYEYAVRKFVREVELSCAVLGVRCAVTGGYAAWQYARACEDPLVAFHTTMEVHAKWMPRDLDVFVCGDDETTDSIVLRAYERMSARLFRPCPILSRAVVRRRATQAERLETRSVAEVMRGLGLSEQIVFPANLSLKRALHTSSFDDLVLRTVDLQSTEYDALTTTVRVVHTRAPPSDNDAPSYACWVGSHFDFCHCCVSASVDGDGEWVFRANDLADDSVRRKTLRFNTCGFDSLMSVVRTTQRMLEYRTYGFRFI